MDSPTTTNEILLKSISEPLRSILILHRTALERDGLIQRRPNQHYRLRYHEEDSNLGCRVHRSISLGRDPEIANAVGDLIQMWKAKAKDLLQRQREDDQRAAKAENLGAARQRIERELVALSVGGGRDQRRQLIKALEAAEKAGPIEMFQFVLALPFRRPKRAARPRRMRLW